MNDVLVTVTYKTADGKQICLEVTVPVQELLEQLDRRLQSQNRQDRRHLDLSPLARKYLDNSLLFSHEDTAVVSEKHERNAQLHEAIRQLTEKQQRRLRLCFFSGLSCDQIAEMEGVSHRAINYSIKQALKQLRETLLEHP